MFLNYLKIAWRNLMKSKIFSFINIFGLAAGLTCCMLIAIYLLHETSYDSYQKDVQRLYEVVTTFDFQQKKTTMPATPWPQAPTMQRDFPEIEQTARLLPMSIFEGKTLLQHREGTAIPTAFYEDKGFMADSTFFRLFTYHFIEGNPATALDQPATIVVSEEIAHKLFGNVPAVGKVIHISSGLDGDHDATVKGVFRPMKAPSNIEANFFLSMRGGDLEATFMKRQENDYVTNNMFVLYLKLRPGANPASLEAKLPAFNDKYAGKALQAYGFTKRQSLIAVRDIHLRSDVESSITPAASKTYLYILASIAVFTLLIACINFMNLATARSAKRSSEVGIRKVLGAVRRSLIGQFLGESVLMSVIAFGLAWAFTVLLLPAFSMMTARELSFNAGDHLLLLAGFFGLAIFAGLLAGLYPAFYLSSFLPVKVLKGKFSNSLAAVSLRKGLVVFQFMISVVLIVSTVVINNQMKYLRNQDLGFNKEAQIVIPLRGAAARGKYLDLETEFRRNNQVISAGAAAYYPGINDPSDNLMYRQGESPQSARRIFMNRVDFDYAQTLGLKPVAGRLFSRDFMADTLARVILNEKAVQAFGFASPQAAIGQKVNADFQGETFTQEIIGVVKDFHFADLHVEVAPHALVFERGEPSYLVVHTRTGATSALLNALGAAWHRVDPNEPFEFSFLDEDFQKNYAAEERLSAMIGYFTVMAILISCLGLFGLARFSAEQRIREIGIRKVLGASVTGIVMLLSTEFLKLVGVAMLIASPLAWWIMHAWLGDFAVRVPIDWMVFAVTFAATLTITLVTIGVQAVRAGMANPVKSLKTE